MLGNLWSWPWVRVSDPGGPGNLKRGPTKVEHDCKLKKSTFTIFLCHRKTSNNFYYKMTLIKCIDQSENDICNIQLVHIAMIRLFLAIQIILCKLLTSLRKKYMSCFRVEQV